MAVGWVWGRGWQGSQLEVVRREWRKDHHPEAAVCESSSKHQLTKTSPHPIPAVCLACPLSFFDCFFPLSFNRIDKKMSGGQSGYELSEAKAILTELKSIRKAISSGEKEKQDLMQVCDRTFFFPQVKLLPSWASEIVLEQKVLHQSLDGPFPPQPHPPPPPPAPHSYGIWSHWRLLQVLSQPLPWRRTDGFQGSDMLIWRLALGDLWDRGWWILEPVYGD